MQELNARVDLDKEKPAEVAQGVPEGVRADLGKSAGWKPSGKQNAGTDAREVTMEGPAEPAGPSVHSAQAGQQEAEQKRAAASMSGSFASASCAATWKAPPAMFRAM